MIRRGELRPGERLLEDRLAEQLGVSRNPVREAIRALEHTGLVEVQHRRGAYVATLDPPRAVDLLELRSAIEAFAARLAAARRTPEQLADIRRCFEEGQAAMQANDVVQAARAHRAFHLAIESAAANSYLGVAVEPLRAQTELVFSTLVDRRGLIGWTEHVEILTAIEAGDGDRASEAARKHMSSVLDDLRRRVAELAEAETEDGQAPTATSAAS